MFIPYGITDFTAVVRIRKRASGYVPFYNFQVFIIRAFFYENIHINLKCTDLFKSLNLSKRSRAYPGK